MYFVTFSNCFTASHIQKAAISKTTAIEPGCESDCVAEFMHHCILSASSMSVNSL